MDRQTLRDWVHRYDADGVVGLGRGHGGGSRPRLTPEQEAEFAGWIRTGPDPAADGVVRWRCADIQGRIARLFGMALHEREPRQAAASAPLRPHLRASTPSRGGHSGTSVFRADFAALMTAALPEAVRAADTPIEVWHQDEARVGQQGTLT